MPFVDDGDEVAAAVAVVVIEVEEEETDSTQAFRGLRRAVAIFLPPSSFMSVDVNIDDK
jgi:ribosomal protein L19